MTVIKTPKAEGFDVPDLHLHVEGPFKRQLTLDEQNADFDVTAETIVEAFYKSMPGGLLDRIVAKLMLRMASSLIVPKRPVEE